MQELASVMKAVDRKIEDLQKVREVLASLNGLGGSAPAVPKVTKVAKGGKRILSAKARAAISRAQKARWAKYKAKQRKAA